MNRAKRARLLADMKISELARRAGITRTTVYAVEADEAHVSLETYIKVASALGVPVSEIVPEERQRELRALTGERESPKELEAEPVPEEVFDKLFPLRIYSHWSDEPNVVRLTILEKHKSGEITTREADVLLRELEGSAKGK